MLPAERKWYGLVNNKSLSEANDDRRTSFEVKSEVSGDQREKY